jgi:tRNA/rRNA methyltransferase
METDQSWLFGRHSIDFVLVQTSHPGNVGAAARAITTMGFERLTLVDPRVSNPQRREQARAMASGANAALDHCRVVPTLAQALQNAQFTIAVSAAGREFAQSPVTPAAVAQRIAADYPIAGVGRDDPAPIALVFGSERNGLSVEQAVMCQAVCSIESNPGFGSLNLAQAVQVLAYVMRQQFLLTHPASPASPAPARKPHSKDSPATHGQLERMFEHLETMMIEIGFLDPDKPKRLMPRLRHLFTRAQPSVTEVDIMRGICTEVQKHCPPDKDRNKPG